MPRTICCRRVLSCTGGLTWKPGGSLCGDSVIACELSREAVSSATALTEEHFMPRDFLALNPEICPKMLFANLLTSISFLHYFYLG